MNKLILMLSFVFVLFGCQNQDDTKLSKYSEIYYNILLIREQYPDTAVANPKIIELLNKYGYNQKTFQDDSFELFDKDRVLFTKMIDSVRKKAELEIEKNKKLNSR